MRRRSLLAALAALPLVGAGAARAQSAVPVRAGFIPVTGSGQLFVVNGEGWAREAGMDLRLTQFDSGPNMIQALGSGTLDVYVAGVGPLGVARARGLDIRVVAATATEELAALAGGRLARHFTEGRTAGQAFAAFFQAERRAAKVATQPAGSVPNTVLQHWLWEVGKVEKAHVEIVPMGIDATQQALLAGAVDGATVREPALTIIRDRDPAARLVATGGQMFPDQPGGVVALTGDFIKRQPDAAQTFVNLIVRATELLTRTPERAAPHLVNALGRGIVDEATMRRALTSPASRFVADPAFIVEPTRLMQDFQVKIGALPKAESLEGLFDRSFYAKAVAARG